MIIKLNSNDRKLSQMISVGYHRGKKSGFALARPCNYAFRWEQEKAAPGDRHLYEFLTEGVFQKIFEYKLFTTSENILHLHDNTGHGAL